MSRVRLRRGALASAQAALRIRTPQGATRRRQAASRRRQAVRRRAQVPGLRVSFHFLFAS